MDLSTYAALMQARRMNKNPRRGFGQFNPNVDRDNYGYQGGFGPLAASLLGTLAPQQEAPVAPNLGGGFGGNTPNIMAPMNTPPAPQYPGTGVPFGGNVAPLIPGLVDDESKKKAFRSGGKVWGGGPKAQPASPILGGFNFSGF